MTYSPDLHAMPKRSFLTQSYLERFRGYVLMAGDADVSSHKG